ncbi:hypothetical protein MBRA1_001370 [Malassezia brasiliensis]|uniref:Uncharacterized protein n=1 Tax=Malassezia brasiliensis TaxID=1821822 RepID=A0AAF0DTY5_9BASI|nr:hypothetical protein MBRA1_001370 [Malassezia brasiliensis]
MYVDARPLRDEERAVVEQYASGAPDDASVAQWPEVRAAITAQIVENTRALPVDAAPMLHRAAPLAHLLREDAAGDASPSVAARELLMDEHGVTAADLHDFYAARTSPPPSGTWDVRLEGEALAQAERSVCEALDEFDAAPPATLQRLAELVLRPTYTTRSKYLAALERVVRVSGTLHAYDAADSEGEGDGSDAALDPPWASSRAASAEAEPIFSPIPFLHESDAAPAEPDAAPTQRPAGLAALGDAEAVYRVPDGRVDELDTAEAPETHGGLADHVEPLSAATS